MPDYLPSNEFELLAWLQNFNTVAAANLAALGFVAGDLTPSTAGTTSYSTALSDSVAKKDAAKSSVSAKNSQKSVVVDVVRNLARRVQAHSGVPDSLKLSLGLPVYNTPATPVTPQAPASLVVSGTEDGINTLKWKSNGNKPGTMYMIEARGSDTAPWVFINATTKTSFEHTDQIPGVKMSYRVRSKRAAGESQYSNVATVYDQIMQQAA